MKLKSCWVLELETSGLLIADLRNIIVQSMLKADIKVLKIEEIYAFSFKNKEALIHKVVI